MGGSGVDPSELKYLILAITGSAVMLLLAWVVTRLWTDYQNEQIDAGELISEIIWISSILICLLFILGLNIY
jgi:integrating conjugative element protein (TIGR03758 family)